MASKTQQIVCIMTRNKMKRYRVECNARPTVEELIAACDRLTEELKKGRKELRKELRRYADFKAENSRKS